MITVFCNRKIRINKLKKLREELAGKYGSDHFVIKTLDDRISSIKLFWWAGI